MLEPLRGLRGFCFIGCIGGRHRADFLWPTATVFLLFLVSFDSDSASASGSSTQAGKTGDFACQSAPNRFRLRRHGSAQLPCSDVAYLSNGLAIVVTIVDDAILLVDVPGVAEFAPVEVANLQPGSRPGYGGGSGQSATRVGLVLHSAAISCYATEWCAVAWAVSSRRLGREHRGAAPSTTMSTVNVQRIEWYQYDDTSGATHTRLLRVGTPQSLNFTGVVNSRSTSTKQGTEPIAQTGAGKGEGRPPPDHALDLHLNGKMLDIFSLATSSRHIAFATLWSVHIPRSSGRQGYPNGTSYQGRANQNSEPPNSTPYQGRANQNSEPPNGTPYQGRANQNSEPPFPIDRLSKSGGTEDVSSPGQTARIFHVLPYGSELQLSTAFVSDEPVTARVAIQMTDLPDGRFAAVWRAVDDVTAVIIEPRDVSLHVSMVRNVSSDGVMPLVAVLPSESMVASIFSRASPSSHADAHRPARSLDSIFSIIITYWLMGTGTLHAKVYRSSDLSSDAAAGGSSGSEPSSERSAMELDGSPASSPPGPYEFQFPPGPSVAVPAVSATLLAFRHGSLCSRRGCHIVPAPTTAPPHGGLRDTGRDFSYVAVATADDMFASLVTLTTFRVRVGVGVRSSDSAGHVDEEGALRSDSDSDSADNVGEPAVARIAWCANNSTSRTFSECTCFPPRSPERSREASQEGSAEGDVADELSCPISLFATCLSPCATAKGGSFSSQWSVAQTMSSSRWDDMHTDYVGASPVFGYDFVLSLSGAAIAFVMFAFHRLLLRKRREAIRPSCRP